MPKFNDLTGMQFGRLSVIERAENRGKSVMWRCSCQCGAEVVTKAYSLTSGATRSCGCYNRERSSQHHTKHGESQTRLNREWRKIKYRCSNPNDDRWEDYGGRGITVCKEWTDSYEAFRDWAIANGYRDDLTIDRIDVNGNYEPGNCRWITNQKQQNNRRDNHYITYKGETHTITEWARIYGVGENCLVHRIRRGWDVERAFTTPMQKKSSNKR